MDRDTDLHIKLLEDRIKSLANNIPASRVVGEIEKPILRLGDELSKRGQLNGVVSEIISFIVEKINNLKSE
jgi:hypothetical protein